MNEKMKELEQKSPIYLGFSSQKGGVGKSTLAEIISAILYYEKGINILVVDCDGMQESFLKLRERDRDTVEENPDIAKGIKAHFEQFEKPSYRIISASAEKALSEVKRELSKNKEEPIELVIFDFPGHASTLELLNLSIEMDYIISPIEADVQSLASCLAYAKTITDIGISTDSARIKELFLLWNKVDRRAKNTIVKEYTREMQEQELSFFDSKIYRSVKFSRELALGGVKEVFRCTYLPPSPALRDGTGIDECIEELLSKIKFSKK
ncbi:ParA family protein [Porphyromonas levii]|uniref:ParA family protein n=1 Tax=Porphyromonas levii TaxID=28114 RepID=UPI003D16055B|nr:hypothetical protein [Porphyromonas levii]